MLLYIQYAVCIKTRFANMLMFMRMGDVYICLSFIFNQ